MVLSLLWYILSIAIILPSEEPSEVLLDTSNQLYMINLNIFWTKGQILDIRVLLDKI